MMPPPSDASEDEIPKFPMDKFEILSAISYAGRSLQFKRDNPNGDHAEYLINYVKIPSPYNPISLLFKFDNLYNPSIDKGAWKRSEEIDFFNESAAACFEADGQRRSIDNVLSNVKILSKSLIEPDVRKAFQKAIVEYVDMHKFTSDDAQQIKSAIKDS